MKYSGKTLAYLLPLVTHILDQPHIQPKIDGPIAIILTVSKSSYMNNEKKIFLKFILLHIILKLPSYRLNTQY